MLGFLGMLKLAIAIIVEESNRKRGIIKRTLGETKGFSKGGREQQKIH